MSKFEALKARGEGKSLLRVTQVIAQLNGKTNTAALHEGYDEMSVYPPATKQEAEAFLRLQIKRCRVNLANAKDRGDNRAKAHLERKLAVYEYLMQMSTSAVNAEAKAMRECSNCKVTSVDIFGLCHCCGKTV